MHVISEAQQDAEKYENVGPSEVAVTIRRRLREVLDRAHEEGWRSGYSAAVTDAQAGRDAGR